MYGGSTSWAEIIIAYTLKHIHFTMENFIITWTPSTQSSSDEVTLDQYKLVHRLCR